MARTEARVTCAIWDDEDFRSLTMEAQWLYNTLLTQKDLSLCGVLTYTPKRFAKLATNAKAPAIQKALDLLREKRYVVFDDDTDELLVRSLIRRDRVLSNNNSIVGMSKAFEAIHSQPVRDAILKEVLRVIAEGVGEGGTEGGTPTGWLKGLPEPVRNRLGKPFAKALALASTRPPPRPPVPPASLLLPPTEHGSSSNLSVGGNASAEEEEDHAQGRETWDALLVSRMTAKRRHDKRDDAIPEGYRLNAWLRSTTDDILANHGEEIRAHLADGMAPPAIVDLLEPPPRPALAEVAPWRDWSPEAPPDEPPASVEGLATVRSALGGGA